ncbi:hypothetical protein E5329_07920 [Petralouisia muris]|jgi:hypothetical protein|uniref:Uncharacterized protein n=1 Tax=Petralouisia muris TaxID=3032872 RepID=A0AC61RYR9_9FIRM|nr:hypothetical protein [Petralouisia muris]TGY96913.1 hypothetical protein E5329_07920 [Petralouisia muris]
MSKETLKNLIELVPEKDIDTLYRVIVKFVPKVVPEPEELEALKIGQEDRAINGTIPHEAVNWD